MKKTINDFYKEIELKDKDGVSYKHTLFDYEKIYEDIAPIFLIISERGAKGKTTQAKRQARLIWEKYNLRTLWVMNTTVFINKEKRSHLTKPFTYLMGIFSGIETVKGQTILSEKGNDDSWYTKFTSLSTAENEKGSRDNYGMMIYDEFNAGLSNIRNKQTDLFSNLIGTLTDPVNIADDKFNKMILHGNNTSLSNKLLVDLDVVKIDEEITNVYLGKFLLMRILAPKMTESDMKIIRERNKDNFKFLLQEKLGKANHVYFNENLYDEINNVNTYMITLPSLSQYAIKIEDYYFLIRLVESEDLGNVFYVFDIKKKDVDGDIYAINKRDIEEGIMFNQNLKKSLLKTLLKNKLYFKSAYIRESVIKAITK